MHGSSWAVPTEVRGTFTKLCYIRQALEGMRMQYMGVILLRAEDQPRQRGTARRVYFMLEGGIIIFLKHLNRLICLMTGLSRGAVG